MIQFEFLDKLYGSLN